MNTNHLLFIITGIILYNIYHDNFIINTLHKNYKILKMIGVVCISLGIYITMKKNPKEGASIFQVIKNFVFYMPLDKKTKDFVEPIMNIQKKTRDEQTNERIEKSGKTSSKRSVSETKKKYVAAKQNWKCNKCKEQLSASFEVDHILRLEWGGTNEVSNLVALCRNCHGDKTSMENL